MKKTNMEAYLDIKAIDIKISQDDVEVLSEGTAYYRLPDDVFNFLTLCQKKHGILGFEWDGTRNFGIVLKKTGVE